MARARRLTAPTGDPAGLVAELRPAPPAEDISDRVASLIDAVRREGDAAVVEQTRRFDHPDFVAQQIRVPAELLARAADQLDPPLRRAIAAAGDQVRAVAEAGLPVSRRITLEAGQTVELRQVPVGAAGCYVPGGRAAYPSSLIMAAVPAMVAGVERIAVASPPGEDGLPSSVVLGAAGLLGIDEIYAVGGVAAIAALAIGTESVRPVNVITGPGNSWVQEAKRQLVGEIGIDGVAGPSEVVVIADASADPRVVAYDLLAQAEHGVDSPAILLSADPEVLDAVESELDAGPEAQGPISLVACADLDAALALAQAFAPEHLQINTAGADTLSEGITTAGAVFVGPGGGTAFGDYVAGSNHILPTGGAARHASAVGPATYLRRMSVVDMNPEAIATLTPHLAALAEAEGFPLHRASAEVRTEGS